MYINKKTEEAIASYNVLPKEEREVVYMQHIYPAFRKLAENIIHNRQLFDYGTETFTDTVTDCVSFLTEKIEKFEPARNKKAFSFFNRVAINFLVANKQKIDRSKKRDTSNLNLIDAQRDVDNEQSNQESSEEISEFTRLWAGWVIENVEHLFKEKRDQMISDAICNVFLNCGNLDILEKKTLFIFIREQVSVKTTKITSVIKRLKPLYYEMLLEYRKNGTRKWKYYIDKLE